MEITVNQFLTQVVEKHLYGVVSTTCVDKSSPGFWEYLMRSNETVLSCSVNIKLIFAGYFVWAAYLFFKMFWNIVCQVSSSIKKLSIIIWIDYIQKRSDSTSATLKSMDHGTYHGGETAHSWLSQGCNIREWVL